MTTQQTAQCTICASNSTLYMTQGEHPIYVCESCGHMFALPVGDDHVEDVYGDDYFFGGGDGYPNYLEEQQLLVKRGHYYAKKLNKYGTPGRILDVGCAAGFLLKGFSDHGWEGTGIEPNPAMVEFGKQELALDLRQGTLETFQDQEPFDLVSMIQVIAHLNDVPGAFKVLQQIIKPGGLLLVETWNQQSYTARMLGQYWHEYCPPSVLNWFTPQRLSGYLSDYGFTLEGTGRTAKMLSVKHAFTLGCNAVGLTPPESITHKIPGGWRVPYPSEDLFWAVYRKSESE